MLQEIKTLLPDVDIPINTMDESRVLVPWEDVDDLVSRSVKGRNLQRLPTVRSFNPLDNQTRAFEHLWLHQTPFRNIVRNGCHPDSPGRSANLDDDFSAPPEFPTSWPISSYHDYVSNLTIAKDPCIHAPAQLAWNLCGADFAVNYNEIGSHVQWLEAAIEQRHSPSCCHLLGQR